MKYIVGVREVHISEYEVEADNEDEAINTIRKDLSIGEITAEPIFFEYSHTQEPDTWSVEKVE